MKIVIRNGHIVDPLQGFDGTGDIVIDGDRISGISCKGESGAAVKDVSAEKGVRIIEAEGFYVTPGLVDLHTHLREPGFEHKETIRTGTAAAIMGGFTAVCCMPNTNPANDSVSVTSYILKKAEQEGSCSVYPIGAITKGQLGQELAEMELMHKNGCVAFSDDGKPVMNSLVMRRALEYSKAFDVPIISHCEDIFLAEGGVMNEGVLSAHLGLKGIPAAAEEIMIARDIILAGLTGGRLHIAHVSTKGSVELIRRAKNDGIDITAETCPHYFSITERAVQGYNTNAKVNPPLRTDDDVAAIREGLRDGTIDAIATDHAPHHREEKMLEFDRAPFGISGLETALGLSLTLVREGVLTLNQLIEKMALKPSKILGIDRGTLKAGSAADVLILDPEEEFTADPERFASMGKNTPFGGWALKGRPAFVISKGRIHEIKG